MLRSAEFKLIYQTGVRMTSRYFAAFCLPSTDDGMTTRFGFTTPRKLGKSVTRNRLKRRMREAVRSHLQNLPAHCAIVFNPRPSVLDASFEDLCLEIGRLFVRCKQL